jgi:hypothetical protein
MGTLSRSGATSIGRITCICGNAQNYVVRVAWCELSRQENLDQAELPCPLDGCRPAIHPELAVSAPQMASHGAGTHVQILDHLGIGEPLVDEQEHFKLAGVSSASTRRMVQMNDLGDRPPTFRLKDLDPITVTV